MNEKTVRVVSTRVMRESDARTIANITSSKELMFRAGQGIAEAIPGNGPVAIVAGKGNNAGDGYVVAHLLHDRGIPVRLLLLSEQFSEDGAYYFDICKKDGIPYEVVSDATDLTVYKDGCIVDCLLGTGFSGTVREPMAGLIQKINESGAYVVSADINSGLNGDTGEGEVFVRSDLTVSIGTYKYGHFIGRAREAMKKRMNADIGIEIYGPYEDITVSEETYF